ncbi:histidinol-phosphate transaminase [Paenibacillus koleovorans]|uniref:histidinol-phosphate transaminase n=1 Tax=Paenibacillus koleovorans TaxID=121608 RepID=UPI000FD73460|nr:histidinol-phosphate transaminase [Paenibacillus koleovorans]
MKPATPSTVQARTLLGQMKPYSPGKPIWEVQRELGLTDVVKLASNENALGPSPLAVTAITMALGELHRYPDAHAFDLRQALSAKLDVAPEQLIVTNGGDELITLLSEAYLEAGDEVIVPEHTFTEYEFGAQLMGAVVRKVPLQPGFEYDWNSIAAAVTDRTKLIYLCTPNNPTGTYMPKPDLLKLLAALPPQVLVILDSAYTHFASADDYTDGLELVREGYPVLVLQTFSKIYGLAGIRVGFGVGPQELIRSILQVKEPFNVNALAQTAAIAALGDEEHVRRSRELVLRERDRLYAGLRGLGVSFTESMSNFILVELGPEAKQRYERLMASGVIVRYGGGWGLPEHVRVSIGLSEENDRLLEALQLVLSEA